MSVVKQTPEPEVSVENLFTPEWLSWLYRWSHRQKLEAGLVVLGIVLLVLGGASVFSLLHYFDDRYLPGTSIDDLNVTGLTTTEAFATLQASQSLPPHTLVIEFADKKISSSSAELDLQRDLKPALAKATTANQQQSLISKLGLILGWKNTTTQISTQLLYDTPAVLEMLSFLDEELRVEPNAPSVILGTSGSVSSLKVNAGSYGRQLQTSETSEQITQQLNAQPLALAQELTVKAQVASTGGQLSESQITAAKTRAERYVGKRRTLAGSDQRLHLTDRDLISLLAFPEGKADEKVNGLLDSWQKTMERPPTDAEFVYDPNTLVVTTFKPHRDGLTLDRFRTREQLLEALQEIETNDTPDQAEYSLALTLAAPQKSLATTNNLGINQVIGIGESEYDHSIPTRIHNVSHTSEKINNSIIKPGEEYSFNKALGDVSRATGFQPAYVIKNGQTVLGDGGGVCQVSTTLFRALLDGGLKISKRKAHSYRVSYYELTNKPGVDATVYSGDVDLRFVNDTKHHILIHTSVDTENLYMKIELYGTSDGRTADIVDHIIWDARPALATVFIPDPTLAPGTKKQIDWAASGIKAKFKNVIKDKNGQVLREDEYYSNYLPWSAKYLVGP